MQAAYRPPMKLKFGGGASASLADGLKPPLAAGGGPTAKIYLRRYFFKQHFLDGLQH